MIQSDHNRGRSSLGLAGAATLAMAGMLVTSAGPAVAGKPTAQSQLVVGETSPTDACSVTFDVTNPNSSGQRIEIGAMDTSNEQKVYSTARIAGGATTTFTVSVPVNATYVGFAANGAGRTYSTVEATVLSC